MANIEKLKVAMIGVGFANVHLERLTTIPNIEIVGHAATTKSTDKLAKASAKWGGRGYTDLAKMLDTERPEVVWVCVPPISHGPIEDELIERKIPFFVEKPVATDYQKASEIGERIKSAGLMVGVGYNWRAMDGIDKVKQLIGDKDENQVLYAEGRWFDSVPPPDWWSVKAMSGGQFVEQATHIMDTARFLLGEASVVTADGEYKNKSLDFPSNITSIVKFNSGILAKISASSQLHPGSQAEIYLKLQQANGNSIQIDRAGITYIKEGQSDFYSGGDSIFNENKAFINAIKGVGSPFSEYLQDALPTQKICCEIQQKSEKY